MIDIEVFIIHNFVHFSILLGVLISIYTLQVCIIHLTSFKEVRAFWISPFISPLVKVIHNLCKVRGIIGGFNDSRRQIASGMGKMAYESMCVI